MLHVLVVHVAPSGPDCVKNRESNVLVLWELEKSRNEGTVFLSSVESLEIHDTAYAPNVKIWTINKFQTHSLHIQLAAGKASKCLGFIWATLTHLVSWRKRKWFQFKSPGGSTSIKERWEKQAHICPGVIMWHQWTFLSQLGKDINSKCQVWIKVHEARRYHHKVRSIVSSLTNQTTKCS